MIHIDDKIAAYICNRFGSKDQDLILIEEMSELTKELIKRRRGKAANLSEEMAHVLMSLAVTAKALGVADYDIYEQVELKLRTMKLKPEFRATAVNTAIVHDLYVNDFEED